MIMCLSAGVAAYFTVDEIFSENRKKSEVVMIGVIWLLTLISYVLGV